jgi:alginate O-acetyltransferase complex protein AlgI
MAFNSSLFLLYFLPVFLAVYFLLPGKSKNLFLLIVSVLFYSWGAPGFVVILALSVILDFILLREMQRHEGRARSLLFWHSVVLNLGVLLYFRYLIPLFVRWNGDHGWFGIPSATWLEVALPIGISFITFQKLACTFDVYKKSFPGFKRFTDYALYIFMFPQLLAGPIVRPGQIAGQITDRSANITIDNKLAGFYRFMIGLAKKVLIADLLRTTVNAIFLLDPSQLSTAIAWMGAITYSFQIYFDFSGYSDMAIGLALMAGFKLPENFNSPYLSRSITEFWRRWHLTLSFWLRDYIFFPLAYSTSRKLPKENYGGIRTDKVIYLIATLVTFLICGFWHGAELNFIAWGLYQGVFMVADRLFLIRYLKKAGKIPATIITFFLITIGWVFFRAGSLHLAFIYLSKMFSFSGGINDIWLHPKFWTVFIVAVIFSFWSGYKKIEQWVARVYHSPSNTILIVMTLLSILLRIICVANIKAAGFSPFIYFRF